MAANKRDPDYYHRVFGDSFHNLANVNVSFSDIGSLDSICYANSYTEVFDCDMVMFGPDPATKRMRIDMYGVDGWDVATLCDFVCRRDRDAFPMIDTSESTEKWHEPAQEPYIEGPDWAEEEPISGGEEEEEELEPTELDEDEEIKQEK